MWTRGGKRRMRRRRRRRRDERRSAVWMRARSLGHAWCFKVGHPLVALSCRRSIGDVDVVAHEPWAGENHLDIGPYCHEPEDVEADEEADCACRVQMCGEERKRRESKSTYYR